MTEVTEKLGERDDRRLGLARARIPTASSSTRSAARSRRSRSTPALGEVRVERIVAVHDVGRIVNPLTASSQVEGGILQGMAFALTEELVVDPTTGVPVNAHLDDYKIPTIADVPEIVIDYPARRPTRTCRRSAPRASASRRSSRPRRRSRTRSRTRPAAARRRCR